MADKNNSQTAVYMYC